MKPIDKIVEGRLERLLEAAQAACPPVASPSPWFEQRVIQALLSEPPSLFAALDNVLVFRMLACACVITLASVALPLLQTKNPYVEAFDLTNSAIQIDQVQ